jgi:hypothetical protein
MGAALGSKKEQIPDIPDLGPIIKPLRMLRKSLMEQL